MATIAVMGAGYVGLPTDARNVLDPKRAAEAALECHGLGR